MIKYIQILSVIIMLNSCGKNDKQLTTQQKIQSDTIKINDTEQIKNGKYCYLNVLMKDSLILKYQVRNGKISGKLIYKNFEKDSSSGDVSGSISGDTLKLNYKFVSEGLTSEREVYFLQKGRILSEGIGEYSDNNSARQKYSSPKKINFSTGRKLTLVDCNIIK